MVENTVAPGATSRVVFGARRPTALVIPLAAITEVAGIISILSDQSIGWFMCGAPVFALLFTAVIARPSLELTSAGIVQRQYPFSSLTRWDAIVDVGLTRVGNRIIMGYRLAPGTPPPKRQPVARLLRAAGSDYDGGYFADSLAAKPDELLAAVCAARTRGDINRRQTGG